MSLRRIGLMAQKETAHVLRDMRTLYLALGIPLVLLLLFGYALTTDVDNVSLLVLDRDHSAASRELESALVRSTAFQVVGRPTDEQAVEHALRRGESRAALIIEHGFERALERGEKSPVQLLVDGTNANDASIAIGFARAVLGTYSAERASLVLARLGFASAGSAGPPVTVKSRAWFNQALKSQWYLVPGLIAVILAMINTILMALTVAREWERGTMEQLLTTPVGRLEIVIGKLTPYLFIGLGQVVLVTGAGVVLFDVPLQGNLGLLFGVSTLFLLASLGQGLLISVVTRNQQVAMMVAMLTSVLPSMLLSGFMSPIASMPALIQQLTYIIPSRYFLVVTRGIFLKGSGLEELWPEVLAIAFFALFFCALSVKRFKTRID